ncbi:MAG: DUF6464 family protein [Cyanobacteria bacterium P01_F01_bin.153]
MTMDTFIKVLTIAGMFGLAIAPAVVAILSLRRTQDQVSRVANTRLARRMARRLASVSSVAGRSPIPDDPEALYIPDFGFVIGDISCQFNGRSPYLRCAINPHGPCSECRYYQERNSTLTNPQSP